MLRISIDEWDNFIEKVICNIVPLIVRTKLKIFIYFSLMGENVLLFRLKYKNEKRNILKVSYDILDNISNLI